MPKDTLQSQTIDMYGFRQMFKKLLTDTALKEISNSYSIALLIFLFGIV